MSSLVYKKLNRSNQLIKYAFHAIFILFSLLCIIPMIMVISISLSDETEIIKHGYSLIPNKITLSAYSYIFKFVGTLLNSYLVTIAITIAGTVTGLLVTTMLAYGISRKTYKYRNITSFYVFFTMLFNGGLVPWYMMIRHYLHLNDTIFVLFVPYIVNAWYVLLMKGFLLGIPESIFESAKIDGSGELRTFFSIVIPVAKAGLATIGLFFGLMYWNDWWLPLLFIDDNKKLVTLQFLLYKTMQNIEFVTQQRGASAININVKNMPNLSARMAMCILATGPMLFAFPFFQKYFVKGMVVGSVKG